MSKLKKLVKNGGLKKRYEPLYKRLLSCDICPVKCKTNRELREGFCGAGFNIKISNAILHFGEEPPLVGEGGSGTIFFTGCTMKCIYCQNMGFSQLGIGVEITEEELAYVMLELQKAGAVNVNLVTASQYTPNVLKTLEIAILEGLNLPIIWNTSGYEDLKTLELLDGIVDIYLADIRYVENDVGLKYSKVPNYWSVTKKALKEMFRQVGPFDGTRGLIIRILVLPGNVTSHEKALKFIAEELSTKIPVSIMRQYMPVFGAKNDPVLSKTVSDEEYERVLAIADQLNLSGWYQLDERQLVPTKGVESIHEFLKSKLKQGNEKKPL